MFLRLPMRVGVLMLHTLWLYLVAEWQRKWDWLMDHVYGVDE